MFGGRGDGTRLKEDFELGEFAIFGLSTCVVEEDG